MHEHHNATYATEITACRAGASAPREDTENVVLLAFSVISVSSVAKK